MRAVIRKDNGRSREEPFNLRFVIGRPRCIACCADRIKTLRWAIEGGAAGLMTKPIDFGALRSEIGRRLGERGQQV